MGWKSLGDVALEQGDFNLAIQCFHEAKDINALFLVQTSCGDFEGLLATAKLAADTGIANIAVLAYIILGDPKMAKDVLVRAGRLPEAAFFSRAYCPSELSEVVKMWKENLSQVNKQIANILAEPVNCPDLFPDFEMAVAAEGIFRERWEKRPFPAQSYEESKELLSMNVQEEIGKLGIDAFRKKVVGLAQAQAPAARPAPAPETVIEAVAPVAASGPELTTADAPPPVVQPPPEVAAGPLDDLLA